MSIISLAALLVRAMTPETAVDADAVSDVLRTVVAPCRTGREVEEVVVCGRRALDRRYRLPQQLDGWHPSSGIESVARERSRLMEGGEAGTGSCSNVGVGGWTGCFARQVTRSIEQRAGHRGAARLMDID